MLNRSSLKGAVLSAALLGAGAPAMAQSYSLDIEILRPTFSAGSVPGIDSPAIDAKGTTRMGFFYQFERDPLILYEFGEYMGGIISNRHSMHLGVAYDFNKRLSGRLVIPTAVNQGTDVAALSAPGFGAGNPSVGLRGVLFNLDPITLGARADLMLPVGTNQAYMGEEGARFTPGFMLQADVRRVAAVLDAGVILRQSVETTEDFVLGSEATLQPSLTYEVLRDKAAIGAGVLTRYGFNNFIQGGAENSMEAVASIQIWPNESYQIDIGGGKGLSDGYGSTEFRGFAGVTYIRKPELEPPPPVIAEPPPDPPPIIFEEEPQEEAVWEEGELARVVDSKIVIREPIQFQVDTAIILKDSLPILEQVATLMNSNAHIVHVVVEGHASEEGNFSYNFDLSNLRSRSIFMKLLEYGVAPSRVSYRGMGEVMPIVEGDSEEAWAANRRVEFKITNQLDTFEEPPVYEEQYLLPWNGELKLTEQPDEMMPEELIRQFQESVNERDQKLDSRSFREDSDEEIPDYEIPSGDGADAPEAPAPEEATQDAERQPAAEDAAETGGN